MLLSGGRNKKQQQQKKTKQKTKKTKNVGMETRTLTIPDAPLRRENPQQTTNHLKIWVFFTNNKDDDSNSAIPQILQACVSRPIYIG